jgi:hypothetical protein
MSYEEEDTCISVDVFGCLLPSLALRSGLLRKEEEEEDEA